jgi:hypothetical protein
MITALGKEEQLVATVLHKRYRRKTIRYVFVEEDKFY